MYSLLLSPKERVDTSHNHRGFFQTHSAFLPGVDDPNYAGKKLYSLSLYCSFESEPSDQLCESKLERNNRDREIATGE